MMRRLAWGLVAAAVVELAWRPAHGAPTSQTFVVSVVVYDRCRIATGTAPGVDVHVLCDRFSGSPRVRLGAEDDVPHQIRTETRGDVRTVTVAF